MNKILVFGVFFAISVAVISVKQSNQSINSSDKETFTNIYKNNVWGKGSGPGSKVENALQFLEFFQNTIKSKDIHSIVDLGCGDWELMKHIEIPNHINYLGIDLVDKIIKINQKKYGKRNIKFKNIDNFEQLISLKGDMLLIKDVMQHWSNEKILFFIQRILPRFKYAVIVNEYKEGCQNKDITTGGCRPLNLEKAPFFMNMEVVQDYETDSLKRVYLYRKENIITK